ncbi:MAG: nitroreductase, partial [Bacteroidales bacterium]|nr:nitroreductase [Bacteroidales bacterium]
SPRAFSPKPVEKEKLQSMIEAARWSPSAFNGQPWRFIVGIKGKGKTYEKIRESMVDFNQIWSITAPVLIVAVGKKVVDANNKPNDSWQYDIGQSMAYLTMQAMDMGLYAHQMTGLSREKLAELFNVPETYEPFSVIAVGYIGDAAQLPEDFQKMERAERSRLPYNELVFEERFGQSSDLF